MRKWNAIVAKVVPYIGTWIETDTYKEIALLLPSRTLYRYVDWNNLEGETPEETDVVPYIGTWIETSGRRHKQQHQTSYLI